MTTATVDRRSDLRAPAVSGPLSPFMVLFLVSLIIPINFFLGGMRLSPYRLVLLIVLIPAIFSFISNPKKRFHIVDFLVIAYTAFVSISFAYHDNGVSTIGIFAIETLGPYFVARSFIHSGDDFKKTFYVLFGFVALFFLPAIIENILNEPIILNALRSVFPDTIPKSYPEERMGMRRAQVVFEHAILYGIFCCMMVASAFYVIGHRLNAVARYLAMGFATVVTFTSLSAGPLVAGMVQWMLVLWDRFFPIPQLKWRVLGLASLSAYVFVDVVANRPPINVFIGYFTFNPGTAFTRVMQWNCGMKSVEKNPILGFGLNGYWERCPGVTNSIDNFWLAIAMRNGAPAILCLMAGVFMACWAAGRRPLSDPRLIDYRKGAMFGLIGCCVGAATVHFWNATYVLFIFFIGVMMWFTDRDIEGTKEPPAAAALADAVDPRNVARTKAAKVREARRALRSAASGPRRRQP